MKDVLQCFSILVGICLSTVFKVTFTIPSYDDYNEVLLDGADDYEDGKSISDYSSEDYENEMESIMKKCKHDYETYDKILKKNPSPTLYISTNRESEEVAENERMHNAIYYGIKKGSCTAKTKVKDMCKNKYSSDYSNDYQDDEDDALKSKVDIYLKKKSKEANALGFRGASMQKGSKETDGMCNPMKYTIPCDPDQRWRSINGTCNNIVYPHWGSIVTLFPRFANSTYDDGKFIPRGGWNSEKLPNPRYLSETLSHARYPINCPTCKKHSRHRTHNDDEPSELFSHMVVSFGQFLTHEMSLTTEPERDCCNKEILAAQKILPRAVQRCWNIDISKDKWFQSVNVTCHPFSRSNFHMCHKKDEITGTHQVNGNTAFIDASGIYGETIEKNRKLRIMKDGLLRTGSNSTGPQLTRLPEAQQCGFKSGSFFIEGPATEVSGDTRAAVQPSLASMHTLFMVEHNRIAKKLKPRLKNVKLPKGVDMDELLFQEARIIIGAQFQKIAYHDYLRSVLGVKRWKLNKFGTFNRSTYSPEVDPSMRNEFSTAAFRFGHSNVAGRWNPKSTDLYNKIGKIIPEFYGNFSIPAFWPLRWHYFDTSLFVTSWYGEEWNEELYGTTLQACQKTDLHVTDDMTDYLFAKGFKHVKQTKDGTPGDEDFPNQDIVARNVQRGRDHGIPTYSQMREYCKLPALTSFNKKPKEISMSTWKELSKAYKTVDQIDFYLGGYAETTIENALVGPTFACIIEKQFNLLRRGDRHFFSHSRGKNSKGVSDVLYKEILDRTLGDIMCANMNILGNNGTQTDVFRLINDSNNPIITCQERNDIDFDEVAQDILQFYASYKPGKSQFFAKNATEKDDVTEEALNNKEGKVTEVGESNEEEVEEEDEKEKDDNVIEKEKAEDKKIISNKEGEITTTTARGNNKPSEVVLTTTMSSKIEGKDSENAGAITTSTIKTKTRDEEGKLTTIQMENIPGKPKASKKYDCLEKNTDYYRNDIVDYAHAQSIGSWQKCSELCRNKYAKCKFWTLIAGKCLIKSSNAGKINKRGAISGSRECGSNTEESGGNQEEKTTSRALIVNEVRKQGSEESQEEKDTSQPPDSSPEGKGKDGKQEEKNTSKSNNSPQGRNQGCMEINTDYFLNDIVPFHEAPSIGTWQECSEICRNKYAECKFWTLIIGKCLVKTSKDGKRNKQGAISGNRECGSNTGESGEKRRQEDNPSEDNSSEEEEQVAEESQEDKNTSQPPDNLSEEKEQDGCIYECDGWPKKHCKSKSSQGNWGSCIAKYDSKGVKYSNYPSCGKLPHGCKPCWKECDSKNA